MNLCRQPHSGSLRRRIEKDNILLFESFTFLPCGHSPYIPLWEPPRKATGHGRGRGGGPNPFPLAAGIFEPLRHDVSPLPIFCLATYSIGLRETVREEFPLCRIILENEMEIVFTLLPCSCGVSRIGETPKKQWFLRRGVGIYKDNPL